MLLSSNTIKRHDRLQAQSIIDRNEGITIMKTSELIEILKQYMECNGDLPVVGIAMGDIYPYIDINCPDSDSPLYIEFAKD